MNTQSPPIVRCPTCKQDVEYTKANSFRPFCSDRCKILDLGAWADEQYRVPLNKSDIDMELSDESSIVPTNDEGD
jgi:endogenous inhibitor of DNA gyrase (YacG/DUF329 family)